MKQYYCWRCECEMPFLEEDEWKQLPTTHETMEEIIRYRLEQKCDLVTARQFAETHQMKVFEELTGMSWVHFDIISHHRLADWGPECVHCGQLLRSQYAPTCTECGGKVPGRENLAKRMLKKFQSFFSRDKK